MRFSVLSLVAVFVLSFSTGAFATNGVTLDCGMEILAIEDVANSTMDIELFDGGPMSREERLAFMPGGKSPSSVNVFLVRVGRWTYLIDTGFGNAIKDGRIDPSKITAVFLTHAHGDHISGLINPDGSAAFNVPVRISRPEHDYWHNPETPNSDMQKNIATLYTPRRNYRTFAFGDTIAQGVVAIDASGHTPGHTAFLVGRGEQKVLIAGDFLHAASLQFPNPSESARFDVDKEKAAQTRIRLMQMAIDNDWYIAGMHIPGGIGKVKANGRGGFEFTPAPAPAESAPAEGVRD